MKHLSEVLQAITTLIGGACIIGGGMGMFFGPYAAMITFGLITMYGGNMVKKELEKIL